MFVICAYMSYSLCTYRESDALDLSVYGRISPGSSEKKV